MSRELAEKLINADGPGAFLNDLGASAKWETVSALKAEVDRLIGSDLTAAERLANLVEQVASALGDSTSRAFADASRARVLHHLGRYAEADRLYESAIRGTRAARLTTDTAVIQMHRVFALTQMGRYDEAFAVSGTVEHDVDGALALMTDDCVWEVPRGRAARGGAKSTDEGRWVLRRPD